MSVWRILYFKPKPKKKFRFYEMPRPHSMWHGDVMTAKRLTTGEILYQLSWEDDYSRTYVASVLGTSKNSVLVIKGLIEAIIKYNVIPTLAHYDNGSEGKCKIVQVFCEALGIKLIHSTVEQPNTNGKKERAHRDDKRDFWHGIESNNISYLRKKNDEYVEWRNTKKGHWALGGKPSITRLEENKKPVANYTKEKLEMFAQVKIDERIVKHGGLVIYEKKAYWTSKEFVGQKIELWETLNGLEIRKEGKTYGTVKDYWDKLSEKV